MRQVALGWWECAAGGKNQPRRTCSRAPGWHGPNGYACCTGDTLALPGRHADAGEEPGGSAALAARLVVGKAAGWAEELSQDQAEAGVRRRKTEGAAADAAGEGAAVKGAVEAAAQGREKNEVVVEAAGRVAKGGSIEAQAVRKADEKT